MGDQAITLLVLLAAVVLFVWNRLPVGVVALGVAVALWATGVVTLEEAVAGFGAPTVVLIAALFVVAEALDAAGITAWAGQQLFTRGGTRQAKLLAMTMLVCAVLSALITPNGAVAALFPLGVVIAVRLRQSPSKLLIPLAYAAHAGSLLVLTGSPVSLLASDAAVEAGGRPFGFFEFLLVGVPTLAGTVLVAVLLGPKLLPDRVARTLPRDLGALPGTLLRQYASGADIARLRVEAGSALAGQPPLAVDGAAYPGVHLLGVRDAAGNPGGGGPIRPGDALVVRGKRDQIARFAADHGLEGAAGPDADLDAFALVNRNLGVAEVIVAPRSNLIGQPAFPGMVTESGELVVLAVQRLGEDVGVGETTLRAGDALLLQGRWEALDEHTIDPNVIVVDSPDAIRRQAIPLGPKAKPALVVLAGMVVLLGTGAVPAVIAGLLAAIAMVVLGVVSVDHAHRAISWTTLILVAGMIPLSTAITDTGVAALLAGGLVDVVGGFGPYAILLALVLFTAVLGQLISNTATALVILPVAASVAMDSGISVQTLMMSVAVSSAAALLTPIATPGNMMVMEPGGYTFGDYVKLGLPVMVVYLLVAVFVVPVFWPM